MANRGYGHVDDKGMLSVASAFEEGAWKSVAIKKYDSEEMLAISPLATTPAAVYWKISGIWGIRGLIRAMNVGNTVELDKAWDSAQRSFSAGVASEEDHEDPAHCAAAGRIRTALLDGAGTQQTQLDLDKEYDFGKKQLLLAEEKSLAADLKLTGLTAKLQRIREATEALGDGIGRAAGKNRAPARWTRIRDALAECAATFNVIHDGLVWAIDHTPSGSDRDKLEQMLEPFQALLDRYPGAGAASPAAAGDVKGAPAATTDGKEPAGAKNG